MFQTKEAIFQNMLTIFSDTNVTSNEIHQVLQENDYNFNLSIKKLSEISASKYFPTNDIKLTSNHIYEGHDSKRENTPYSYESIPHLIHYIKEKENKTPEERKHALSFIGMNYPGIVQLLFRKFASLIPGQPYEFSFTIGSKDNFKNEDDRNRICNFIHLFCQEMCGDQDFTFDQEKGIINFKVYCFNPSFRSMPNKFNIQFD